MSLSIALTTLVAAIFIVLGTAKVLAVAPMRARAADVGFSVTAYRRIGALELAGAAGLLIGLTLPLVGRLAGAGLLLLLAGAFATHLRHRDGLHELAPAAVCAALVAGYLIALAGGMP
jgi:hypothetical protein